MDEPQCSFAIPNLNAHTSLVFIVICKSAWTIYFVSLEFMSEKVSS